jgi:hypothetical protein
VDLDEKAFLATWAESIQSPEGQARCVYALGMLMGKFLVDQAESDSSERSPDEGREMVLLVNKLRSMLIDAGADLHLIEDIWVHFQETLAFEGPTIWDHILEAHQQ